MVSPHRPHSLYISAHKDLDTDAPFNLSYEAGAQCLYPDSGIDNSSRTSASPQTGITIPLFGSRCNSSSTKRITSPRCLDPILARACASTSCNTCQGTQGNALENPGPEIHPRDCPRLASCSWSIVQLPAPLSSFRPRRQSSHTNPPKTTPTPAYHVAVLVLRRPLAFSTPATFVADCKISVICKHYRVNLVTSHLLHVPPPSKPPPCYQHAHATAQP